MDAPSWTSPSRPVRPGPGSDGPLPSVGHGRPGGRRSPGWRVGLVLLGGLLISPRPVACRVVRVEIESRSMVLDGRAFGNAGPYERLVGRIYFAFDPRSPHDAQIVDLALAPKNADGLVEAWTEFMVLQPVEGARRRNVAWIEVPNRGGKASLRYFQAAVSSVNPVREEHFGDGLLMRQGLTLIWVGWQPDIPDRAGLLRLVVPTLKDAGGGDIEGLVRSDWTVDEPAETLGIGHRGHRAYPVSRPDDPANVLTVRDSRDGARDAGGHLPAAGGEFSYQKDGRRPGGCFCPGYRCPNRCR